MAALPQSARNEPTPGATISTVRVVTPNFTYVQKMIFSPWGPVRSTQVAGAPSQVGALP
jgi:hypothetical protein